MKRSAALATVRTRPSGYRGKMIESGEAPFKCRSGSRYLYIDEFGSVHWCYQTREAFSKDLLAYTYADLREQFDTAKRPNGLRDGPVALSAGPCRRSSCGNCVMKAS
jgi:hypothetical protein